MKKTIITSITALAAVAITVAYSYASVDQGAYTFVGVPTNPVNLWLPGEPVNIPMQNGALVPTHNPQKTINGNRLQG